MDAALELQKLRWCVLHAEDPDALAMVSPTAIEAWIVARGARLLAEWPAFADYEGPDKRHPYIHVRRFTSTQDGRRVLSPSDTLYTLKEIASRFGTAPALILADVLPPTGPWTKETP